MNSLREQILQKTNGGLNVFTHYFGEQAGKKVFLNVYRNDTRPSCKLKKHSDRYYMLDYGDNDWSGDCFFVVAMIEQLNDKSDFMKVMAIINKELSLGLDMSVSDDFHSRRIEDLPVVNTKSSSTITRYSYKQHDFDSQDLQWWGRYGITLDVLKRYQVFRLSYCSFYYDDGHPFNLYYSDQYPLYGYMFQDRTDKKLKVGMKIYRPGAQLRFLQMGFISKPYRFGHSQLPIQGDTLYIVGGEKDVMSMASRHLCAVCYNSETASIPSDDIIDFAKRFSRIVVLYDMDKTGIKSSQHLVDLFREAYGIDNIFRGSLPLKGVKFDKDVSDYFAKGSSLDDFLHDLIIT